jgi:hypothetical protein
MSDNFQSKPIAKLPKAHKSVQLKTTSDATDVVASSTINETALSFIRSWKKARASQQ